MIQTPLLIRAIPHFLISSFRHAKQQSTQLTVSAMTAIIPIPVVCLLRLPCSQFFSRLLRVSFADRRDNERPECREFLQMSKRYYESSFVDRVENRHRSNPQEFGSRAVVVCGGPAERLVFVRQ